MVQKGSAAAKEIDDQMGRGGSNFAKASYLSIKDGESEVVRFLDEDSAEADNAWLVVLEHAFIDTRDPRAQHQGSPAVPDKTIENWPRKMNATCRKNKGYEFPDCYICDNVKTDKGRPKKPSLRVYARVCMREEIKGTKEMADAGEIPAYKVGKPVGYSDKTKEIDEVDAEGKPTGNKRVTLDIRIAAFSWNNFYSALSTAAQRFGTILDRDYSITRSGEGLDTEYLPMPLDQMTWNGPDDKEPDQPYTLEDPRLLEYYLNEVDFDLEAMIDNRASDDYFERFFDVRKPIPVRENEGQDRDSSSNSSTATEAPAAQKADPEHDQKMMSMGSRLRNSAMKPKV